MRKNTCITVNIMIYFLIFMIFSIKEVSSQNKIKFEQYSLNEGLSQTTVYDIAQDKKGNLWVATGDGLNRYDGSKFTIYRHNRNDSKSLLDSYVRSLYFDSKSRLWIGTQSGLSRYDQEHEQFINYPDSNQKERRNILDIIEINGNKLILATAQGLSMFDEKLGYKNLSVLKNMKINNLLRYKHRIIVGANNGLFYYYPESDSYELVHEEFAGKQIMALQINKKENNTLWIGTEGSGLYLFDTVYKKFVNYRHNQNDKKSLSSDFIRSLAYDSSNRLWIGSFVGLNISTDIDGVFDQYFNNKYEKGSISQNSIRSLFNDNQGGIWCGSYYGGLNYYHPLKEQFEHIHYIPNSNTLNDDIISAMLVDEADNIWIGTNDNGLNYYNTKTESFTHYLRNERNSNSLPANNVKSILSIGKGDLMVGTHGGGVSHFTASNKQFKRLKISDNSNANNNVYALLKDLSGTIWIGTLEGLVLYNPNTSEVSPLTRDHKGVNLINSCILTLYSDRNNKIWIGTENGINRYNQVSKSFETVCPSNQNNRSINCITEDKNNRIWVGTRTGLLYYDNEKHTFVDLSIASKFPEIAIFGIQHDNFNQLWISTSSGLYVLDPTTNKWRVYSESDGIQSNQFSMYSYCKTRQGKMYFGGINGITAFNPERLNDNPYTPPAIIDRLTVFNKLVLPGDENGILKKSISEVKEVRIKSSQSLFGLDFSTPNFLSGKKNLYTYKLEGFDTDWYFTERGSVTYSNLNPGTYLFKVNVANNNGRWSTQITELKIIILPQWWQTWWAKLFYIISIIGIIAFFAKFYTEKKLMKRELELERLEQEQKERLNDAKIKFFIHISHEFRTPLTLILSPLQEILQKGLHDRWMREQLEHMYRNTKRMIHLINQVMDYSRSQSSALELHVSQQEVSVFIREIYDMFSKLAVNKRIHYGYNCTIGNKQIYCDTNYIERILSNLISNAFKFTPVDGSIDVEITEKDDFLIIKVSDTGCGIPADKKDKIFEQFYQVEENVKGSGIGLALVKNLVDAHHGEIALKSEPGKGSVFTVMLPCAKKFFTSGELTTDNEHFVTEGQHELSKRDAELLNLNEPVSPETIETSYPERKRILLVEDDEEVRRYLYENFSSSYTIIQAENGDIAWKKLIENPDIDLILSDVMMPVMDGMMLCKNVKQNIQFSHIPIILLTARIGIEDQLSGLQIGADDYISKPFILSILKAKINNIFKTRQRTIQHYSSSTVADISQLTNNPLDEEFLKKAVAIIEKNMENPEFSTEDFSREMGMSRSNLYLKLKALTNESAVEFIRRIRFGYACKLLKEGRYNVSEISVMVGFTPSYFATSFKKYMGCLPSEYAKNNTI